MLTDFFARDYSGRPFVRFGTAHLEVAAARVRHHQPVLAVLRLGQQPDWQQLPLRPRQAAHPYYLLAMEVLGILLCLLLYLPFALKDRRKPASQISY
jgi:hypothetical protein